MRKKTIPYVRIGNVVRFDPEKVEQAIAKYGIVAACDSRKGGLK